MKKAYPPPSGVSSKRCCLNKHKMNRLDKLFRLLRWSKFFIGAKQNLFLDFFVTYESFKCKQSDVEMCFPSINPLVSANDKQINVSEGIYYDSFLFEIMSTVDQLKNVKLEFLFKKT